EPLARASDNHLETHAETALRLELADEGRLSKAIFTIFSMLMGCLKKQSRLLISAVPNTDEVLVRAEVDSESCNPSLFTILSDESAVALDQINCSNADMIKLGVSKLLIALHGGRISSETLVSNITRVQVHLPIGH